MLKYIYITLIYCFFYSAYAQSPVNDNCISAFSLTVNSNCNATVGTLSLSTQSLPPITCGIGTSSLAKDVWYSFIASAPDATIIASPNQQAGNNFNLVLGLYSACGGTLISCSDQYGNLQPETIQVSGLTVGNVYYMNVYQYKNSVSSPDPANPTFSICVLSNSVAPSPVPPLNDNCSSSQSLTVNPTCVYAVSSLSNSTQSIPASACNSLTSATANDVWFSFTAAQSNATISAVPFFEASGNNDLVIELLSSCSGSVIQCSNSFAENQSENMLVSGLTIGSTYNVRIYYYKSINTIPDPANPTFSICVLSNSVAPSPVPPLNDNCSSSQSLTVNSTCVYAVSSLSNSTQSIPASACNSLTSATANDVWFSFTATQSNATISAVPFFEASGNNDLVIELLSSCSGSVIQCSNSFAENQSENMSVSGLTIGSTYNVRIYYYKSINTIPDPANPTFSICVLSNSVAPSPVPPLNDNCSSSQSLTVNPTCVYAVSSLSNSTQSIPASACNSLTSATANDVWFSFTATQTNATISAVPFFEASGNNDLVIELLSSCSGSVIQCSNSFSENQSENMSVSGLTIGSTYNVRIYYYKSINTIPDPANPTFSICVVSDLNTNVTAFEDVEKILIGPNPTQSVLFLNNELMNATHSILVFDNNGKTILFTDVIERTLNLENLLPGEYHIMFIQKNAGYNPKDRAINKKIIKQ